MHLCESFSLPELQVLRTSQDGSRVLQDRISSSSSTTMSKQGRGDLGRAEGGEQGETLRALSNGVTAHDVKSVAQRDRETPLKRVFSMDLHKAER